MVNVTTPSKERWVMVLILLLTLLVAYVDRVNVSVLMADNTFLTDMGIKGDPVSMGLLMTSFLAAYGLGNVFLSPLGDILGPRRAMSLSILLWCGALFIGGLAGTFAMMIGALAHAEQIRKKLVPTNRAWQGEFDMDIRFVHWSALAMPFFAWVIQGLGWRMSFFILVLIGLIPLSLIWFLTKDHPHEHKRSIVPV